MASHLDNHLVTDEVKNLNLEDNEIKVIRIPNYDTIPLFFVQRDRKESVLHERCSTLYLDTLEQSKRIDNENLKNSMAVLREKLKSSILASGNRYEAVFTMCDEEAKTSRNYYSLQKETEGMNWGFLGLLILRNTLKAFRMIEVLETEFKDDLQVMERLECIKKALSEFILSVKDYEGGFTFRSANDKYQFNEVFNLCKSYAENN